MTCTSESNAVTVTYLKMFATIWSNCRSHAGVGMAVINRLDHVDPSTNLFNSANNIRAVCQPSGQEISFWHVLLRVIAVLV